MTILRRLLACVVWLGNVLLLTVLFAGCEEGNHLTNTAPVPVAPAIQTTANTPGTSQVMPNDPDPGETFTFAITTPPARGTATISATGLLTYTPTQGFVGTGCPRCDGH